MEISDDKVARLSQPSADLAGKIEEIVVSGSGHNMWLFPKKSNPARAAIRGVIEPKIIVIRTMHRIPCEYAAPQPLF